MQLIQNNPYRIAGILSNSSEKELQRQKGRIIAHARIGRETETEFDFQFLKKVSRAELTFIEDAFANIQQSQDKINYALFWFIDLNAFDNTSINYLKEGNLEKAIEILERVTNQKDITSKNFSNFSNLSTLKLMSNLLADIKKGVEIQTKLIESDYFENFVHSIAGIAIIIDRKKQIENFIDLILSEFKNKYSSSDILNLFSNCSSASKKYLSQKFTSEPIHKIERLIESTKKKRQNDESNAYTFGKSLSKETKSDLNLLKTLLDKNDLKYKTVVDNLAKEIMQCGIDYYNYNQENEKDNNYYESAMELAKEAESIAVGQFTKDKAKDNINSLRELRA